MNFNYYNPKTLTELFNDLHGIQNYSLLAGGTDLLVKMNDGIISPENIVDINDIRELTGIREESDSLYIGSLVTHAELTESLIVKEKAYVLAEAANQVGSPQIMNMGTLGGNIGTASPAADTVPPLLVLDTKVELQSTQGSEEIELFDIFKGPGKIGISKGQIITRLIITSIKENEGAVFIKVGRRKALAISIVNGAVWLKISDKHIDKVRIALGSVAPTPIRLFEIEEWLTGQNLEEKVFEEAGKKAKEIVKPIDDIRSTAHYRKLMVAQVVSDGLRIAAQRAQEV